MVLPVAQSQRLKEMQVVLVQAREDLDLKVDLLEALEALPMMLLGAQEMLVLLSQQLLVTLWEARMMLADGKCYLHSSKSKCH
jgi:hypothetical protein